MKKPTVQTESDIIIFFNPLTGQVELDDAIFDYMILIGAKQNVTSFNLPEQKKTSAASSVSTLPKTKEANTFNFRHL